MLMHMDMHMHGMLIGIRIASLHMSDHMYKKAKSNTKRQLSKGHISAK